jgi:hypothetical protein
VHVLRPNPTDSHVYARPSDHSPGTARDGSLYLRRPQNQRSTVSHWCVTSPSPAVTHHSARESRGTNPVNPRPSPRWRHHAAWPLMSQAPVGSYSSLRSDSIEV